MQRYASAWHMFGEKVMNMTLNPDQDQDLNDADNSGFVADYLLYLLAAASNGASAQFHDEVRQEGLRVPEWRVLACLNDRDGEMITRLAHFSLFEQSRLTRIIAQMEIRALVKRKSDPQDGRRVRVYLTETGRQLATRLVPKAKAHEAALLALLDPQQTALIKPALRAMLAALENESDVTG